MKKMLLVVAMLLVLALASGCAPTLDAVENNVRANAQHFFDVTGNLPRAQAVVLSVRLTDTGDGYYTGTATVLWGTISKTCDLGLEVQRNGSKLDINWDTMAVLFLNQMDSILSY